MNPFGGDGPTTSRVKRKGVLLVQPNELADPTNADAMCPGELRPSAVYLDSVQDVQLNDGLFTFDLKCTKPTTSDDVYLTHVRERQDKVRHFLDMVMFDIHAMDKYSTQHADVFKNRFAEPGGHRKQRELAQAYKDLLHAYAVVDKELMWCADSLNAAAATIDPARLRVLRNSLEQYGCSPEMTERMFDAVRVLYFKRMQRVKHLFRTVVAGYDVEGDEEEWNSIGRRQDSFVFRGLAYVSAAIRTSMKQVSVMFRRYCDKATAVKAGMMFASMTVTALSQPKEFSWVTNRMIEVAGGYAMAPIYMCYLAQNLDYYVKCADMLKANLWNWSTGEGSVHPSLRRVFDAFSKLIKSDVGLQSALTRAAHAKNEGQNEELKEHSVNHPEKGGVAANFAAWIDFMSEFIGHKYVRYVVSVCNHSFAAANVLKATSMSYFWGGVTLGTEMARSVPESVTLLYASAVNDMGAYVAKSAESLVESVVLWKTPNNTDMMNVSGKTLEKLVGPINLTTGDAPIAIPVDVVTISDETALKNFLKDFLPLETQEQLHAMATVAVDKVKGFITPLGDFVKEATGASVEEQLVGASYIASWLLYAAAAASAVKMLKSNTDDPLSFSADDVSLIERLQRERGDIIEKSILINGRVNPVPNPHAVYARCASLGGSRAECIQATRRATQHACANRGCKGPDPLIHSVLATEDLHGA